MLASLDGPFAFFTTDTPVRAVSRHAVYGQKIIRDKAVVATFDGGPADIANRDGLAAVVNASGSVSHLSISAWTATATST
ncbi:hypothetical protein [Dyella lutea]|uniref:Uncharacterized protein n=1 Tax=Dyella lutea TaxID=2950441 RepID=A0ABT1FCV9_9GAMM|nr:hypothetical protein [Dyella lutea]MCP1375211.1 hypothetical protein [Dyella lutea]